MIIYSSRNADVYGLIRAVSFSLRKFKTTDSFLVVDCMVTKQAQWVEFDLFHAVFEHLTAFQAKKLYILKTEEDSLNIRRNEYTLRL